ncbi:MAG: ScpA family protein [Candidatus Micrarchaeota archaeon]
MANQLQLTSFQSFSSFETMVSKPTWKDILLELISSNRIDPWNIDLAALADAFIRRVREMESMDFVLQANVILAASILLKYKSESLKALSYQSDLTEYEEAPDPALNEAEEFPQLTLSSRIPPKRQVTIDELITEMERFIHYDESERVRIPRGAIVDTVDLDLGERDIEKDMADTLSLVEKNADGTGWALFSSIVRGRDMQGMVYTLLCLLHLVCEGSLDIKQDEMFGEIFIHLNKN